MSAGVAAATLAIAYGLLRRDELDLAAHDGVGYALGIFGLACMTLLLAYSVRKRMRALRRVGRVSSWFQVHMLLGLLGPVAILYHCGFRLGSMNSNVALLCALVVAASGVVGRVIYTRIHHGLSDERATAAELRSGVEGERRALAGGRDESELWSDLDALERRVDEPRRGALGSFFDYLLLGHRCRRARRKTRRRVDALGLAAAERRALRTGVDRYVRSVRRLGALATQERVFALWHVLHLPLCFLLFLSAIFHVLAVHMY